MLLWPLVGRRKKTGRHEPDYPEQLNLNKYLLKMKPNVVNTTYINLHPEEIRENLKNQKPRFATSWRTVLPLKFLNSKIVY